jgi:hypothetical protein
MKQHQLFSIYCGDTLIDVWGESMSMDDITDYRIADTDISVYEMIDELDTSGKFNKLVKQRMYEVMYA